MMFTSRTQNIYYAQFPCQLFHREVEKRNWTEPKRHINWRRSRKKRTQMKSECVFLLRRETSQHTKLCSSDEYRIQFSDRESEMELPMSNQREKIAFTIRFGCARCLSTRERIKKWKEIESPRLNCYFVDSLLITRGKKWILLLNLSAVSQCQCECRKKKLKREKVARASMACSNFSVVITFVPHPYPNRTGRMVFISRKGHRVDFIFMISNVHASCETQRTHPETRKINHYGDNNQPWLEKEEAETK